MNNKTLTKSAADKKLAGVCAGFANYLDKDPTFIRVIWALFSFFYGAGVLLYIVCALIMPEETVSQPDNSTGANAVANPQPDICVNAEAVAEKEPTNEQI